MYPPRDPLFAATPTRSNRKGYHQPGHTFFRSYGANLPSSLTRVLSSALVYSTHLPVSDCGTVTRPAPRAAFLGSMGSVSVASTVVSAPHHLSRLRPPVCPTRGPKKALYRLKPTSISELTYPSPSPPASQRTRWCRNINLLAIAYALRPRLRIRLTLGGLALPRKP